MDLYTSGYTSEINEAPDLEGTVEGKLMYVPELGPCEVCGDPVEVGGSLDDLQGDNLYQAKGDCGLVSVSNLLTLAGLDVNEDAVVGRAISMRLCSYSTAMDPSDRGGTNVMERRMLLQSYGISSEVYSSKDVAGSLNSLAGYLEAGRGVNISVNAGYLWNDPNYILNGTSNHSIILTGTVRDLQTSELKGFYACDSGLTDRDSAAMFISVEDMEEAYVNVGGTSALVTSDPIRSV